MIKTRNLLRKILIAVFALFIATPLFADVNDVGDFGRWSTEQNRQLVTGQITNELQHFGPTETTVSNAYVPVEAKLGLAFMGGISKIGIALDSSLVRFAIIFMLIAYAFWVAFESYNLIGSGTDAKETLKEVLMQGIKISVCIVILNLGVAKIFSIIMVPIISVGTVIATTIWESITSVAGYSMPNTCEAIKQYAMTNAPSDLQLTADSAASLLCIPTQMSGFFVTIMNIGWKWVISGVGKSLFASLLGIYITYLALKNIWKYLFIALGVIADIFLSLLMLPFTAIAETTAKTKYKGVAGDIFNSFLKIFDAESLEKQITRIIQALVYFINLAVVTGVAVSLLTFIIDPNTGQILSDKDDLMGIILLILSLLLVCYMADKAQSLAESWGGKIDAGLGIQFQKDIERLLKLAKTKFKRNKTQDSNSDSESSDYGSESGEDSTDNDPQHKQITSDVTLIGYSEVGKTALLERLSRIKPVPLKISGFNKTPVFGSMYSNRRKLTLAELPCISVPSFYGTNPQKAFLPYIRYTKLFLNMIDASESDWVFRYQENRKELQSYHAGLTLTKQIIVINKKDLVTDAELNARMTALQNSFTTTTAPKIFVIGASYNEGIDDLADEIKRVVI